MIGVTLLAMPHAIADTTTAFAIFRYARNDFRNVCMALSPHMSVAFPT